MFRQNRTQYRNALLEYPTANCSTMIRGLIDNAIKYTPEGGHIAISAREVDQTIAINVSDTGKGIPENDLPHNNKHTK